MTDKAKLSWVLHKHFLRNPHWIDLIKRENKGINQPRVSMIELLSARVSIFFLIRNWTEPDLTSAHLTQLSISFIPRMYSLSLSLIDITLLDLLCFEGKNGKPFRILL